MRTRLFEVVQYEKNPKTGESLDFDESNIISALEHKSIKQYAYIRHTEDPYTQHDWDEYVKREGDEPDWEVGDIKPPHWHCVCKCQSTPLELDVIARWFGVPVQQIDVPKGRDAFLDKVQYLTHEDLKQQEMGKRLYDDSCVTANFDFRGELDERAANKLKYGKDLDAAGRMLYDVLYNGMTLRQCLDADRAVYMDNLDKLRKYRADYLNRAEVPSVRINYYLCGDGGIGKGLMARALARSLYPQYEYDDDIFFEVGAKGSAFEGYDGQPVIIWNDRRAIDLLEELGSRNNVFNVFDSHPTRQRQNIKYASIGLINAVNIVNSVQPYKEFLDGLVGEYKDKHGKLVKSEQAQKSQGYRRFPFIIPIHEEDFDLLINRGFAEGNRNFEDYIAYQHIRGNMQRIAEACGNNEQLAREITSQTLQTVTDKHNEIVDRISMQEVDEDAVRAQFADYGKVGKV